jgi:hypothetical protein
MTTSTNGLSKRDLEMIERVIYKQGDDVAVSIARSFERLEERIDAAESRLYSRFAELEDKVEEHRQSLADEFGGIRSDLRDFAKPEATLDP